MEKKDKHLRYLKLARELSRKSTHHTYRLGCVIVKSNRVVGVGYNQLKSHPKSPDAWKTMHAEFHAILGVKPHELQGGVAYTFRETKCGKWALARPCKSCEKMLSSCGLKSVVHTINDSYSVLEL